MNQKATWIRTVIKFQKSGYRNNFVQMQNRDRSIRGELPMDGLFEILFGARDKFYCECKYREEDGYLKIGREVKADW